MPETDNFLPPLLAHLANSAAEAGSDQPIRPDTKLLQTGLLDSIGIVGLIQFIESRFAIEIPDADLTPELLETPASIAAWLAGRR